jgi:Flp pilus assembly protein TadG
VIRRAWIIVARLSGDTCAAEIAELASVLPLLIVMIFGILWFGRAFNIYTTVHHAARAAADAAAVRTCATCGNGIVGDATIQSSVVNPILTASHLDPAQLAMPPIRRDVVMNPNSGNNVLGVVVTLNYPYRFTLNGITCCPPALTPVAVGITVHATAQAQEEN